MLPNTSPRNPRFMLILTAVRGKQAVSLPTVLPSTPVRYPSIITFLAETFLLITLEARSPSENNVQVLFKINQQLGHV